MTRPVIQKAMEVVYVYSHKCRLKPSDKMNQFMSELQT